MHSGWHRAQGNMKGFHSQNEGKGVQGPENKMLATSCLVPPAAVLLHSFLLEYLLSALKAHGQGLPFP